MKKIVSVLICMIMLLSVIPLTASAADEARFTLRIKEETDKSLTLVIDFDGGTGFSALDFEVEYDRVRLQAKSCKKGDGYKAFEDSLNDMVSPIYSSNANKNPLMFSMANISPFKITDGKKSIAEMVFTKVPGTKFEKDDVSVKFTNCQTVEFKDISVSFDYDLSEPVSTSATVSAEQDETDYAQEPSSDNVDGDSEIGEAVAGESENTDSDTAFENTDDSNADDGKNNVKTVVIIVASVLAVAGVGTIILVNFKKKK